VNIQDLTGSETDASWEICNCHTPKFVIQCHWSVLQCF